MIFFLCCVQLTVLSHHFSDGQRCVRPDPGVRCHTADLVEIFATRSVIVASQWAKESVSAADAAGWRRRTLTSSLGAAFGFFLAVPSREFRFFEIIVGLWKISQRMERANTKGNDMQRRYFQTSKHYRVSWNNHGGRVMVAAVNDLPTANRQPCSLVNYRTTEKIWEAVSQLRSSPLWMNTLVTATRGVENHLSKTTV